MVAEPSFLPPRFENMPSGLKSQPWAVWLAEPRKGKPGKFDKAPRSPLTGQKVGADKPDLFGTFEQAQTAYLTGGFTGVGVLLTGSGIVGIDIDDVRKVIAEQPEVRAWIGKALGRDAYCELSPSNTGLRLFIRGMPLSGEMKKKHGGLEIYDNLRFLTVTGHVVRRQPTDA